jgi:hypothetical protein
VFLPNLSRGTFRLKRPTRVMMVCGSVPPAQPVCGVADATAQLANGLSDLGLQVGMVSGGTSLGPASRQFVGLSTHLFPVMAEWNARDIPRFFRTIKEWQPDIIHFHYPAQGYGKSWTPYFLPLLSKLSGYQVVQTWHEHTRYRFFPNAIPRDTLIVVEPDFLDRIMKRYKYLVRRKDVHFIPIISNIPATTLSSEERTSIRSQWLFGAKNLVSYFGFVYPGKGLEAVFQISDPDQDAVLIIGELDFDGNPYHRSFRALIKRPPWKNRVAVTGYVNSLFAAQLLAASDAVLCPFEDGVRPNNGSFLAACAQGTFVVTTSRDKSGYDPRGNVSFSPPGDIPAMRQALRSHVGRRTPPRTDDQAALHQLASEHLRLYEHILDHRGALTLDP